jgi:hypothetical protein
MNTDRTIDRLRRANPASATSGHDEALLAEIVAAPGDPRLGRPQRRSRRRLVFVVALAAAVILVPTGVALDRWVFGPVPPKVTKQEYTAAQHDLTLPPGVTWPQLHVDPDSVTSAGAGGGHAVLIAQNAWECYWVAAAHRGDAAAGDKAHAELEDLMHHHVAIAPEGAPEDWTPPPSVARPVAVFADDGGYEYVEKSYANAAAGDASGIEQSCKANRPG